MRTKTKSDLGDILVRLVDQGGGASRIAGTRMHVGYLPGCRFELSRMNEDVSEGTLLAVIAVMRKLGVHLTAETAVKSVDENGWHIVRWELSEVG